MSEISDMIQRLCPDGVEYRKLGRLSHCSTLSILLTMTSARRHLRSGGRAGPYPEAASVHPIMLFVLFPYPVLSKFSN